MSPNALLLGIDGGGTQCRARLCTDFGEKLSEATAGPANIRYGLEESFAAIRQAATACLTQAGLSSRDMSTITACLALAGASEPAHLAAAQGYEHPFYRASVTTDAHAACVGAHSGRDGGIIVIGTGSIGWAERKGLHCRAGGWGWPLSDEGSGAWLGHEALRRVLWAHDGRMPWTGLLTQLFERFQSDPHAIVTWASNASPREFGGLAPTIVGFSLRNDSVAVDLMRLAASHIDALAARLIAIGTERLALVGGLSTHLAPWLAETTKLHLVEPEGDALDGAVHLAKSAAAGDAMGSLARKVERAL